MKKYLGILLMTTCLLVVGCSSDKKADGDAASTAREAITPERPTTEKPKPITQLPKEMPEDFISSDIPLYKNAKIQNVAQHNHASRPKTQVRFKTNSSPKDVEIFYLATMKQKGWKITNSTKKPPENGAHFSVYNNGEKQFLVNSLQHPETKVTIATMILMDFTAPGSKAPKKAAE